MSRIPRFYSLFKRVAVNIEQSRVRLELSTLGYSMTSRLKAKSLDVNYMTTVISDPEKFQSESTVRTIGRAAGTFMPRGFGWPTVMMVEPISPLTTELVYLVDAKSLLRYLCHVFPGHLTPFFSCWGRPGPTAVFTYSFFERHEGIYHARIPKDCDWGYCYAHYQAKQLYRSCLPAVHIVRIEPGEALLVDNRRMLHELSMRSAVRLGVVNSLPDYTGGFQLFSYEDAIIGSMINEPNEAGCRLMVPK